MGLHMRIDSMEELIILCKGIVNDLREIKKTLAIICKLRNPQLSDDWNRKDVTIKLLDISPRTYYRLLETKKLPYSKVNGIVYVKSSEIEKLLNDNFKNN
jgi:hypothetical protein